MALPLDDAEVLEREVNATVGSFIAGVRFDLRWDAAKFARMCSAMHAAAKVQQGNHDLPRDLSQLFWYCGAFLPWWLQQREFTVGQRSVDYERAVKLLRRLGDEWFGDDCLLTDAEFAREMAAI